MVELSIIIPIFNVEKYLSKCIDSVLNQKFKDFELILINDGSTDGCGNICDKYAKLDKRIKVIHKTNEGVSAARNDGLKISKGKYVSFIDSDDYISIDMYEVLIRKIKETDSEIAICGINIRDEEDKIIYQTPDGNDSIYSRDLFVEQQFEMPALIRLGVVNKVFLKEALVNVKFSEDIKCAEDTLFLYETSFNINRVIFIRNAFYQNIHRTGSAMRGGLSGKDILESFKVNKKIIKSVKINYESLFDKAFAHYIDLCIWKYLNYKKYSNLKVYKVNNTRSYYLKKMRSMIFKETLYILKSKHIKWKQKICYILITLNLR